MSVVVITGSGGLIGAEAVRLFAEHGHKIAGIDNDMRAYFFGPSASTRWAVDRLRSELSSYCHYSIDIRDDRAIERIFSEYGTAVSAVIHAASQPSHDWAARDPGTDFGVNALGTLNLLEATRRHSPDAVFMFLSTNRFTETHRIPYHLSKVRGDSNTPPSTPTPCSGLTSECP